ncbi:MULTISPECIES: cbb3-type cytochrome c oxidase subunit 3 [Modicisalibacter]|uniref:cbb3-type cytochrome oxidase subunit 3 n=1 Tax=Modicisalibacter TaxID=574347 RepID=UPI00100AF426|nr:MULTISPECIES: cbb3-type cytochrome c oxidase subunit 3 [Halomonadaceae]MBZ9559282.1 cbb3-type cytochrome c oxidase subunit 3 [Modicisalibacter sp. R2A 31.J]MBZ9576553.1 cbb3-type cytochrome c oxidase subunit 3 [Modicisalibacter sp. MOD 31.J]
MDIGTFRGLMTLLILIAFLGVVAWAYSTRRKSDFDEASRLPFADDEDEDATPPGRDAPPARQKKGGNDT